MSTPNLPIRHELINDGTGPAATLEAICVSVISEGGFEPQGVIVSVSTEQTWCDANVADTRYVVLAVRHQLGHSSSSIQFLKSETMCFAAADVYEWSVVLNPTIGGSLTWMPVSGSECIEKAIGATANTAVGGELLMASGYGVGKALGVQEILSTQKLGAKLDGTRDIVALCVRPVHSSTGVDVFGAMTFRELK
jgi:hypothetical protein